MTKQDLIHAIATQADISKAAATRALEAVTTGITEALQRGENVTLMGFGRFHVSERPARTGRNPRTGEAVDIPASRAPKFSAGKGLKDAVNA